MHLCVRTDVFITSQVEIFLYGILSECEALNENLFLQSQVMEFSCNGPVESFCGRENYLGIIE